MRKLFFIAFLFIFSSCFKDQHEPIHALSRTDFFADKKDMLQKVQAALSQYKRNEILEYIDVVSYVDGIRKSYAVVFYHSNRGPNNLIIQKEYTSEQKIEFTTSKCEGSYCECKIRTVIEDNGDVSVSCSCSSCSIVTGNSPTPDSTLQNQ
jgi:hypothetical protein